MDPIKDFVNVSEINKEKSQEKPEQMTELQLFVGSEEYKRLEAEEDKQHEIGNKLLNGNRYEKPEEAQSRPIDFFSNKVRDAIKQKVADNMATYMDQNIQYSQVTRNYVEYQEGRLAQQLDDLKKLSNVYDKLPLKKREKELKQAEKYFAKMDKVKEKIDREPDPAKKLRYKTEIVDLKMKALICRAKAYGKDDATLNDEIANLEIAANYEILKLQKDYYTYLEKEFMSGDDYLEEQNYRNKRVEADEIAKKNINKIALRRRRQSGLEIFNAAAERTKSEKLNLDWTGQTESQASQNQKMADASRKIMEEEALEDGCDKLDHLTEEKFDKKADKSVVGALAIRKRLKDFSREIDRNIGRMEEGKPLLQVSQQALNAQYRNMVHMCSKYLEENTAKKDSNVEVEKESYAFVKQLRDKLLKNVDERDPQNVTFSVRFVGLNQQFITHRRQNWTTFKDRDEEKHRSILYEQRMERKGGKEALLKIKSADLLNDKHMEAAWGTADVIELKELQTKSDEVKWKEDGNSKDLNTLKYNMPEGEAWVHDNSLLAIDLLLRSKGIQLEGGARDLLKAIPKEVANMGDVFEHFDQLLFKHKALETCKSFIEKLSKGRLTVEHKEYVVPKVDESEALEHDAFTDQLIDEIMEGLASGSAVMLYDSVSRHYVTITAVEYDGKTPYVTVLDGTLKDEKNRGIPVSYKFADYMANKLGWMEKITIEYLKENKKDSEVQAEKKEEKKAEAPVVPIIDNALIELEPIMTDYKKVHEQLAAAIGNVTYKASELKAGNAFDILYEKANNLQTYFDHLLQVYSSRIGITKGDYFKPVPELQAEITNLRNEMLQFINQNRDFFGQVDKGVVQAIDALENNLKGLELSKLSKEVIAYNKQFDPKSCEKEKNESKKTLKKQDEIITSHKLNANDMQYATMLKRDEYDYIVAAHKNRDQLVLKDLEKYRTINTTKDTTKIEDLSSDKQHRNNCWACSADVLLRSRGIRVENGSKGVIRYLPDRIRTMKEAADYYAFVANKEYSLEEHSEFFEKVAGKEYELQNKNIYNDKDEGDFVKEIKAQLTVALNAGSAVSLRDPVRKHYITITGITKDKIKVVDGNDNDGKPQDLQLDGYFEAMYKGKKGNAVSMYWLAKKGKRKNK